MKTMKGKPQAVPETDPEGQGKLDAVCPSLKMGATFTLGNWPEGVVDGRGFKVARRGGRVGAFVCGVGTGGTIPGVGGFLRARCPGVRVILTDHPKNWEWRAVH
jgi:hypothetical protein